MQEEDTTASQGERLGRNDTELTLTRFLNPKTAREGTPVLKPGGLWSFSWLSSHTAISPACEMHTCLPPGLSLSSHLSQV